MKFSTVCNFLIRYEKIEFFRYNISLTAFQKTEEKYEPELKIDLSEAFFH